MDEKTLFAFIVWDSLTMIKGSRKASEHTGVPPQPKKPHMDEKNYGTRIPEILPNSTIYFARNRKDEDFIEDGRRI